MRTIGVNNLRLALRRLKKRFSPSGLILLYHRIAETRSDPWGLCVSPRHFAEHLEVLTRQRSVVSLQQMVQTLEGGNLPRRAIALTFDDGYADNLHNAKPLLERFQVPATVFMTTGWLGQEHSFWWDQLDRLLLQTDSLPETLQLTINDREYSWRLGQAAHLNEEEFLQYRSWKAWEDGPTARHTLYYTLWQLLRTAVENERLQVLNRIAAWAGVTHAHHPGYSLLSAAEVLALARGTLVEIGSHSVTHPLLSSLPVSSQREEIQQSKICLEEILGHPVVSFAFPYGDYTAETVSIVSEAGFKCACSTAGHVVRKSSSCFQLPRLHVLDWDGEVFARQLSEWFSDN